MVGGPGRQVITFVDKFEVCPTGVQSEKLPSVPLELKPWIKPRISNRQRVFHIQNVT